MNGMMVSGVHIKVVLSRRQLNMRDSHFRPRPGLGSRGECFFFWFNQLGNKWPFRAILRAGLLLGSQVRVTQERAGEGSYFLKNPAEVLNISFTSGGMVCPLSQTCIKRSLSANAVVCAF